MSDPRRGVQFHNISISGAVIPSVKILIVGQSNMMALIAAYGQQISANSSQFDETGISFIRNRKADQTLIEWGGDEIRSAAQEAISGQAD